MSEGYQYDETAQFDLQNGRHPVCPPIRPKDQQPGPSSRFEVNLTTESTESAEKLTPESNLQPSTFNLQPSTFNLQPVTCNPSSRARLRSRRCREIPRCGTRPRFLHSAPPLRAGPPVGMTNARTCNRWM